MHIHITCVFRFLALSCPPQSPTSRTAAPQDEPVGPLARRGDPGQDGRSRHATRGSRTMRREGRMSRRALALVTALGLVSLGGAVAVEHGSASQGAAASTRVARVID